MSQAVERLCERVHFTVETACSLFGHTLQAYYQKKRDECEWMRWVDRIIDVVLDPVARI